MRRGGGGRRGEGRVKKMGGSRGMVWYGKWEERRGGGDYIGMEINRME